MKHRNLLNEIEPLLKDKQIIAICGMRRTGKTTLIKHLLDKFPSNKKYFDLERVEYRFLFSEGNYQNIVNALQLEGLNLNDKSYIAIDEIQLVPGITSVIKFLYDSYDIKFFVTGSSSFYMKNQFAESLAGRKFLFELHTLSFDEFLQFRDIKLNLPKFEFQKANQYFIRKLSSYYEEYIKFGGFPEVVLTDYTETKKKYLSDVLNSYLNLDIKFLTDFTTTNEVYKLLKLLAARVGSKTDYTKISGISGINRKRVKEYLLFLEGTFFIKLISPYVTNTDREIALQKKIYFSDNGLLNILERISPGAMFENMIANQLYKLGAVKYYARKSGQEIDFIVDEKLALEVKETPSEKDLRILSNRVEKLNINQLHIIGRYFPSSGFDDFIWGGSIF